METTEGGGSEHRHVPVLLERVLALFAPALEAVGPSEQPVLVDATVGLGGHSEALLRRFGTLRIVGLDRDPAALQHCARRLAPFGARVELVHTVYDHIPEVLERLRLPKVAGVLLDLGVSSMQLDEADRGFAYAHDAPLDMRMDPGTELTAADVLNTYSVGDLTRVLRGFGDERYARRIATAIVAERGARPFENSARLVELIRESIPAPARRTGGNPAKRTFQALRIEVNGELRVLADAMPAAVDALAVGGRIVVLTYHSGEDRIVKRALVERSVESGPPGLPVALPDSSPVLRMLARGDAPDSAEIAANPRAASARVRAAEKMREPGRAA